jgi:hypothetical protein
MSLTILMLSFVAVFLIFNVAYSLYTGETNISYRMVSRKNNNRFFWVAIFVNMIVAAGFIVLIVLNALGLIH